MVVTSWRSMIKTLMRKVFRNRVVKAQRNVGATSTSLELLECRTVLTPFVTSIQALSPPPNPNNGNITSVPYEVTFDSPVTGVDVSDFKVVLTGNLKASGPITVTPVDSNLDRYRVVVDGITGGGTLRLDLIDNDSITDGTDPLAGAGLFNGSFQGQTLQVLHTSPVAYEITRLNPSTPNTLSPTVEFSVKFSQNVTGVDAADFQLFPTGSVTTSDPLTVTGSGDSYVVRVTGVTGEGSLALLLSDNGTIRNAENGRLTRLDQAVLAINAVPPESIIPSAFADEVALFDLNGDQQQDLVFLTSSTNSISVALGNGNGTFQAPTLYATGAGPRGLTIEDINGDGRPDLLVVNRFSNNVSILRGNGDGTFQPSTFLQTNLFPSAITVGDIAHDGLPEIIVTSDYNASVRVFMAAGNGTFPTFVDFSTGNGPAAVALADVNHDGDVDLIIANKDSDSISILHSDGDSGFVNPQTLPTGDSPSDLAVGDINHDGFVDVVVANKGSDYLSVFLGSATGELSPAVSYSITSITNGSGVANVGLADLNNDGHLDIFFVVDGGTSLGALTGDGLGAFGEPYSFIGGSNLAGVAAADINGDGRIDLMTADTTGGVTRLLNITQGSQSGQSYNYFNSQPEIVTSGNVSIDENTPSSTVVLDVNVYDPDVPGQTLTFSISGPDAALFSIDSATGEIRFLTSPDFELPADADVDNVYEFSVTVTDGASGSATQQVSIEVLPINDNSPVIDSPATVDVVENYPNNLVVLRVHATDADRPFQLLGYQLSGDDAAYFSLDLETGEIRFAVNPDFELPVDTNGDNVYEITVKVSDGNGRSTSQNIAIRVLPANDNTPVIPEIQPVEVVENTPSATVIYRVLATDADLPAQLLTYSLTGPDASWFSLDPATGELRFLSPPDYENPLDADGDNVYELRVVVSDNSEPQSQLFLVRVLPQNDNPPQITSLPFANVLENAAVTDVVLDIDATDADRPQQTLTYALSGPDAACFTLDPDTGVLRFNFSPDYEIPVDANHDNAYELIVTVSDGNGLSTTQNIAIAVQPVNDNSPTISSPASALVNHLTPQSTVVLDVNATDADAPLQNLVYSLSGVDAPLFSIDSVTGQIRFLASPNFYAPLDMGSDNVYDLIVQVSDGGSPVLSAFQEVTITVALLNSAPVVTDGALETAEDTANTGILNGLDPNQGDTLTFSIVLPPQHGTVVIDDALTGAYTYTPDPDYNGPDGFTFKAGDGSLFSNVATVYITVTAVNDVPVITSTEFSLRENVSAGHVVGTVTAIDPDLGDTRSFAITGGNVEGTFAVDPATGVITVASTAALDFDARPSFDLVVTVTDSQLAVGTATITIIVRPALVVTFPSPVPDYVPQSGPMTIDPSVEARDAEVPDINYREGRLTVSILSPQAGDLLSIQTQGNGPGKISVLYDYIVYESSLVIIGKVVSNPPGGPLVIQFTSFATEPAVDALLRAITYHNTNSNPTTGLRTIHFDITDGTGTERDSKTKSINVIEPVITPETPLFELSEGSVSYLNRSTPTTVDSLATVDEGHLADFRGGRLTVAISQGPTKYSRLGIWPSFGITVSGRKVLFDGQVIGRLTLNQTSLTVEFNSSAVTRTAVQALMRSVTFSTKNGNRDLSDRQLKFTLTDGHGQSLIRTKVVHVVNVV